MVVDAMRERVARRLYRSFLQRSRWYAEGANTAIPKLASGFDVHMSSGNPGCLVHAVLEGAYRVTAPARIRH